MGIAGVKRIRDPDFISAEVNKLVKLGISADLIYLLKRMLDPNVDTRIDPLDALNDPVLSPTPGVSTEDEAIRKWRRAKSTFDSLPLFARHVRRLFVHEMNDSEFPHLRYLFRMVDQQARGIVNIPEEDGDRYFEYGEFITLGLEDNDLEGRLGSFFRFLSNGEDLIREEALLEKFPGLNIQVMRRMIRSCEPGELPNKINPMNLGDFRRCMLKSVT